MRKNIKLSESDLTRIVKRVINEGVCMHMEPVKNYKELPEGTYDKNVKVSTRANGYCFSVIIDGVTYTID